MAEGPNNGVNDQLELVRRHGEEGAKAVVGDGSQQAEKLQAVLWELLQDPCTSMTCNKASKSFCWAKFDGLAETV